MKKDQYIPHEISMRNTSEVMNLIEKEGMEGYGIYWAIMEYLRVQDAPSLPPSPHSLSGSLWKRIRSFLIRCWS